MTTWTAAARETAWPDLDDLGWEWYRELADQNWEPSPPRTGPTP